MILISPAFKDNTTIPQKYTCEGLGVSPALQFDDVPELTESLVLIFTDPDAPTGLFTHWIVINIDPGVPLLKENVTLPPNMLGVNDAGTQAYSGPCPPGGTHRYIFKLYALSTPLKMLSPGLKRPEVEKAMEGLVMDTAELTGVYGQE